ncbi:MAG: type II secretion system F family protein [Lachnospiraceae bacterium]|nr:type II secretion system F family protein [Lachnospiraceae bacterium]
MNGERVNGIVEAYNEFDAADRVKQTCKLVLNLTEVNEEKKNILLMDLDANKLDKKAFTLMCNQFAVILRSGVPIGRTVRLIYEKTENKNLHRVLGKVAEDVVAGRSLSAAFAERGGNLFPITFIETIRAGEESGSLADSFEAVSRFFSKRVKLAAKVRGALIYPTFVLVIAIAVVIVLMTKVVPVFTSIFDSMNMELPAITKALIATSDFFRKYTLLIVAIIVLIVLIMRVYARNSEGRMKLAKLQLQLPVLGKVAWLDSASQFANTMAMMLAAGLPITRAVSITAKTIENYYISYEVGSLTVKLEEGRSLFSGLTESGSLPSILVDMVGVGEETGELETTLGTIGRYYDDELEQATSEAIAKLEPAILVVLAGIAGFIVIGMYVAMFSMYNGM